MSETSAATNTASAEHSPKQYFCLGAVGLQMAVVHWSSSDAI